MRPDVPRRGAVQPNPPAAMAGAVDLAAVKARSEAAARAAQAPAPVAGQYVMDVDEAGFQTDVLDRSFQVPVLLDLWAEWCQPCKQLSPILERLANTGNGSWVLAKIDADANPRISQALQVQSLPSVFAVIGGQVIPGFQGLLPEAQVREFIDAVLQAGRESGLPEAPPPPDTADAGAAGAAPGEAPAPVEEPQDLRFTAAEEALDAGDYALATERYEAILAAEPANQDAALALGQVRLMQRLESVDQAAIARAEQAPDDVDAQLAAADLSLAGSDVDGALSRLVACIANAAGDERERVRKRLLEYFDLLGADDPRVAPARRQLTRALF